MLIGPGRDDEFGELLTGSLERAVIVKGVLGVAGCNALSIGAVDRRREDGEQLRQLELVAPALRLRIHRVFHQLVGSSITVSSVSGLGS